VHSDEQIHEAVLNELKWDSDVVGANIWVEVDEGIVTLAGTVGTEEAKRAAQAAVHRVVGVLGVANDLQVHPPSSFAETDTDIAYAVRAALAQRLAGSHERIHATVTDGWVTLEGTVDTARERSRAQRAISHLPGVQGVTNQIAIAVPQS
jgi:osmotically-inducible protein OsmY